MVSKHWPFSEEQTEFIKSANKLTNAFHDLLIKWHTLDSEDDQLACIGYPFGESLEDVWASVSQWSEGIIKNFKESNHFSPTITVRQMKKVLDGLEDDEQIVIWDEQKMWWLNIGSVDVPDQENLFTLVLYPKDTFDTRQF